jgi:hypothetical protein
VWLGREAEAAATAAEAERQRAAEEERRRKEEERAEREAEKRALRRLQKKHAVRLLGSVEVARPPKVSRARSLRHTKP